MILLYINKTMTTKFFTNILAKENIKHNKPKLTKKNCKYKTYYFGLNKFTIPKLTKLNCKIGKNN